MHAQSRSPSNQKRLKAKRAKDDQIKLTSAWARTAPPASIEPLLCAALLCVAYIAFDIGIRDTGKATLIFLLGAYVLLLLPEHTRLRSALETLWRVGFTLDVLARSFLMSVYQTNPDAALVLDAVGNTTVSESVEFIMHHAIDVTIHLGVAALVASIMLWSMFARRKGGTRLGFSVAGLFLLAALHANATVRAANPFLYWPSQMTSYAKYQDSIRYLSTKREATVRRLKTMDVTYTGSERNTVALVIGESVYRGNWSLYGYSRQTSPLLDAWSGDLLVFRDVLAAHSNTVGALRHMLTATNRTNGLDADAEPSVTLLARAAGYKTFWISNQHDRYINNRFAPEADVAMLVNSGGRRSDRSLDVQVIPAWESALNDPAPKKFIIVHLLGAHPHYEQRRPDAFQIFNGISDAVTVEMKRAGRMPWIVSMRNEYDNALSYHDHVVGGLLGSFRARESAHASSFLYTSDHGQDVGHTRNHAGHAENLPGYEVPMFLWSSVPVSKAASENLATRPYQNDVLDWTLLDLLDISTRGEEPWNSLISPLFQPRERSFESSAAREDG